MSSPSRQSLHQACSHFSQLSNSDPWLHRGNRTHLKCPFKCVQAILQTATTHGANPAKPVPINTAYICWQLARQEQLASILSMLAGVLSKPSLPSAFMTALAQLGSAAATLSDLAQVHRRCVSEAASLSPEMTSVTIGLLVPIAVAVVVIVGVVVAGVVIVVKMPNSCSIHTSKEASD